MRRLALSLSFLTVFPACEAARELFGSEPEIQIDSRGEVVLPVSRNVGRVPADGRARHLALDVGQWTRYAVRHADGSVTEIYRQVVAEEPRGFWVEVVNGRPDAGTVTQLLVAKEPGGTPQGPRVLAARVRMPNSVIKEIEGVSMRATHGGYQQLLSDMRLTAQPSGEEQTAEVPAGSFEGCRTADLDITFAGVETITAGCFHPRVPLGGLVRATNAAGSPSVVLTGFGIEGARSVLERRKPARTRR